ncbi:transglycosylase domain-containing protein [Micrococcales bacterium 31B]|nr:transglycosylase domain-containing protein [Micrococcales bacterium 31B]
MPTASRSPQTSKAGKRRLINYPRRNKRGFWRWVPSFWLVMGLFFTGGLAVAAALVVAYFVIEVPEPTDVAVAQASTVYYSDGVTPIGRFSEINREVIEASTIPTSMKQAIVASEDSTFYTNNGVDLRGIGRAVVNNVQGNAQQGASTITMQYIENYYLGTNKSYVGKIQEALLAFKIEQQADKDTILSSYLNTIYFGRGAYGIQEAAKRYFGKSAADLTVSESAMLAGIVPAPSAYDPAVSPETATLRWNRVLDRMVALNMISSADRAQQVFPTVIDFEPEQTYLGTNGYLMNLVHQELQQVVGLSEDRISRGGLRIITTFDKTTQDAAVQSVNDLGERPAGNHVGITSINPTNGAVLALYGGADYLQVQHNDATQAILQAGSTFKAFTLAAALENGSTLATRLPGNSGARVEGWVGPDGSNRVANDSGESLGETVSLLAATEHSLNSAFAELNAQIGADKTREAAVRAGIPADTNGLNDTLSNVLGTASPHVIDVASAYATFAAEGMRYQPYMVQSVVDPAGEVFTAAPAGTQAFSANVANTVNEALKGVVENGTGTRAAALGRPAAGKTGTSDESSIWFVGYTPQIATAVAMFQTNEVGNPMRLEPFGEYTSMYGNTYPLDLWLAVQGAYLEGKPIAQFTEPPSSLVNPAPAPRRTAESTPEPSDEPSDTPSEATTEPSDAGVPDTPGPDATDSTNPTDATDTSTEPGAATTDGPDAQPSGGSEPSTNQPGGSDGAPNPQPTTGDNAGGGNPGGGTDPQPGTGDVSGVAPPADVAVPEVPVAPRE